MATVLDTGVLNYFLPVFVFLFVFTAVFALLEKTKILGASKTLNVAAALSIAVMTLFTGSFVSLISIIVPWFIFLAVILFLVFMIFGFFSGESDFTKTIGSTWKIFGQTPIFVIMLIIILVGISIVFDTTLSPYSVSSPEAVAVAATTSGSNITELTTTGATNSREQTIKTLTHPRMLAALIMLIIAAASMRYLVDKYEWFFYLIFIKKINSK